MQGQRGVSMTVELYLKAPHKSAGRRLHWRVIHLDEPGVPGYPLHHKLSRLPAAPGLPGPAAAAFLTAALGVWAAKAAAAPTSPDARTRKITLQPPRQPGLAAPGPALVPPP